MSCVYIGNLSYRAREKDVEYFFRGYGRTFGISLKNGYGFIEFDDYRDADDAVYELNGKDLCGERISLEHSRSAPHGRDRDRVTGTGRSGSGRDRSDRHDRGGGFGGRGAPPIRTEHRLVVKNLSSRSTWKDLKDLMREVGDVMYADCHRTCTGEGIVEFSSRDDMKRAIRKLDGEELNGKKIKLIEDVPRRSKHRSGSRSRSRHSRSRSRSRSRSPRKRSHSRSRSVSKGRLNKSRSRSRSSRKMKSSSKSPRDDRKSASRSRSHSPSRSRSSSCSKPKSKSPSPNQDQKEEMVNGKDINGHSKDGEMDSESVDNGNQ